MVIWKNLFPTSLKRKDYFQRCISNKHRNLSPLNWPKPAILSTLLCLTPDDFTRQWGTPGVNGLSKNLFGHVIL